MEISTIHVIGTTLLLLSWFFFKLLIMAIQKSGSFIMSLAMPTQRIRNIEEEEKDEEGEDEEDEEEEVEGNEEEEQEEEEVEEEEHGKRWSDDAPEDILTLIKTRLKFVDQLQFGAVCTGWNSVPDCVVELPFMLCMQHDPWGGLRVCGLYDLSTQKKHTFHHQLILPNGHKKFDVPHVFSSKRGWLFLLAMSNSTNECKAILFHAFTLETIHLPDLNMDGFHQYGRARGMFSTLPTCSDCVFYFALIDNHSEDRSDGEIVLFTYRYGDETWRFVKLPTPPRGFEIEHMMYMNNLVYFTSPGGEIWKFDENWVKIDIDRSAINTSDMGFIFELIEYNGEMLLVGFCIFPPRTCVVYKVDWSRKEWVEQVNEVSNLALFMGDTGNVSCAGSVTMDNYDEKIQSLERKFYPEDPCDGHTRGFFYLVYHGGKLRRFLPKGTRYVVWVKTT